MCFLTLETLLGVWLRTSAISHSLVRVMRIFGVSSCRHYDDIEIVVAFGGSCLGTMKSVWESIGAELFVQSSLSFAHLPEPSSHPISHSF